MPHPLVPPGLYSLPGSARHVTLQSVSGESNTNINVLIVDDQPVARDMVRAILKSGGFTSVLVTEDAAQAEIVMSNTDIGLIICDWNMPGTTGLELLKTVRSSEKYSQIPFMMLTAESERKKVEAAIQAGVSNYLVKPFTAETLLAKVRLTLKP